MTEINEQTIPYWLLFMDLVSTQHSIHHLEIYHQLHVTFVFKLQNCLAQRSTISVVFCCDIESVRVTTKTYQSVQNRQKDLKSHGGLLVGN